MQSKLPGLFVHGGAAIPHALLGALVAQADRLKNVELIQLHTEGNATYARSEYEQSFRISNLFVGANIRPYLDYSRVDYLPCFCLKSPSFFACIWDFACS